MTVSDAAPPSYVDSHHDAPLIDVKVPEPEAPVQQQQQQPIAAQMIAGPVAGPVNGSSAPPVVYYYQDPATGNRIATLLPPDHPEMLCLQYGHTTKTHFGVLGVLVAVLAFPWGIAACLLDRRVKCTRCQRIISDGLSC
ncbi:hypothetical protein BKA62DRAFT_753062 [Auriculariales sp. MPI-PUGE-AT-0066]|nr:hypothetical protein BKA62DRAFT_753062 [Auriculariales sp. MPI-PUGE-AT-0066]